MNLIAIPVLLALAGVVVALFWGVISMARGGYYDHAHSEQLMFTRVGIQAIAVALIVFALYMTLA